MSPINLVALRASLLISILFTLGIMAACGGGDTKASAPESEGVVTEGDEAHPIVITYKGDGFYEKFFYDPEDTDKVVFRERRTIEDETLIGRIMVNDGKDVFMIHYKNSVVVTKIEYYNAEGDVEYVMDLISKIGIQD